MTIQKNVVSAFQFPPKNAAFVDFPDFISGRIREILNNNHIQQIYKHQYDCFQEIRSGKHIVISSGTSSGKSLCYFLPIMDTVENDQNASALLLFPTKALSNDQLNKAHTYLDPLYNGHQNADPSHIISVFDGDTNRQNRRIYRQKSRIIITNPDMLHVSILPNHNMWGDFFSALTYVVIDEIHTYRGVFGSHFSNVMRRLNRIFEYYSASPRFICTSATISNPIDISEKLTDHQFSGINIDRSGSGEKNFYFINPPMIDAELGTRGNPILEVRKIAEFLYVNRQQTIIFAKSRKAVEIMYKDLRDHVSVKASEIAGYRSGYTKKRRREIEERIRSGDLRLIISTNALELGIDVGTVDAIILLGYPGSIANFIQQTGRAGRNHRSARSFFIASPFPIDQYIVNNPAYLFDKKPESALVNPNNPLILFQHLLCSVYELPLCKNSSFGDIKGRDLIDYLNLFSEENYVIEENEKYFWCSQTYPSVNISLRNIAGERISLYENVYQAENCIGNMDFISSKKNIHKGAIYLHDGESYCVSELDFHNQKALVRKKQADYFTAPIIKSTCVLEKRKDKHEKNNYEKNFGDIKVIEHISGYRKINKKTKVILDTSVLEFAPDTIPTKGIWITFGDSLVQTLINKNMWSNHSVNYGENWNQIRLKILIRDHFTCQFCGLTQIEKDLHVHHKIPIRMFTDNQKANLAENLITLCSSCHHLAEQNVRLQTGLSGSAYIISHIATLFLMCAHNDLGYLVNSNFENTKEKFHILLYDRIPGGIGLSQHLYSILNLVIKSCIDTIASCSCEKGCPACVGPPGENGMGAKNIAKNLIQQIYDRE